jgi:3-deoxy-D-manno-octulosonate 8-phosphate phosphatase (KDO 8-P phosphatase)
MTNIRKDFHAIKAFVFDVDGVLSGTTAILHPSGEMMRTMNIRDGFAMQYAVKKGYKIAVITGGDSESVRMRFNKLGIKDVYLNSSNKIEHFRHFLEKYDLRPADVLYMGDDLPDYEPMKEAGLSACPADAAEEIKSIAGYISHCRGGEGCARDVIEQVLRLQGKWAHADAFHW